MKTEIKKLTDMRKKHIDVLVASFYKETQVGRSIKSLQKEGIQIDKDKFKEELKRSIKKLIKKVDCNQIKNKDIRKQIRELSKKTHASVGQAQKVINVYLKVYCLLLNKPIKILKELDCPLDSITMNKENRMKTIKTMEEYVSWQDKFEKEHKIRLLKDIEYDKNRMRVSFKK